MGLSKEVSFPIAKLLKEKDWKNATLSCYFEDGEFRQNIIRDTYGYSGDEYTVEYSELTKNWNDDFIRKKNGDECFGCSKSKGYFETFSAPTIAEVVDWIYEKHGIWIEVNRFKDHSANVNDDYMFRSNCTNLIEFNTLTEAYEKAIEHCLTKL